MEPVNDPRLYSNRYQVTHLIARGGMAIVYRAQDTLLNRAVALKILYPELSEDPLFVERFRREAQAAANLSHPNIVPVFDWGEDGDTYFIVMELVDGTSLAEMLRGGATLTAARSAQIVAQVAAALGYAHRSGVVHRDVKPGNILITRDGQVKVTDFGIAQAVSSEDHLAEAGSVMGTATYFSPEQAEGAAVDGRSDVYSLGIVLYEMLVGRPPFIGDTPVEVSSQHVRSTVPALSQFSSSVPHDLEAIVMEALSKSPSNRYQSADELRADLIRFSEGQPVHAAMRDTAFFGEDATRAVAAVAGERTRSVPVMTGPRTDVRRRRNRSYSGAVLVLVILLIAVGAYAFFAHNKTTTTSMPNVVGQQLTAATQTLKSKNINVGNVISDRSRKAQGTILRTVPKAGATVTKGGSVVIFVSKGITTTPESVPSVTGQNVTNAISSLKSKKLVYKIVQTATAPSGVSAAPNTVLSESPAAGQTVQSGTTVILTVLAPSAKYDLDSLSGETSVAAGAALATQGLTAAPVTRVCSDTYRQGLVVATNPAAGSLVAQGQAITLELSSGPCTVIMPGVVNDTESAADQLLQGQGLTPSYSPDPTAVCNPGATPTVASQAISAGSPVKYGSTVNLTICQTPADTTTSTTTTTTTTTP
jgi:beta-lactam-binding protein with PASTA domain/tRNA A-37 threonylcarbamoyl transferase component Bud32